MSEYVTYSHCNDRNVPKTRYRGPAQEPVPPWAVDVQIELPEKVELTLAEEVDVRIEILKNTMTFCKMIVNMDKNPAMKNANKAILKALENHLEDLNFIKSKV